MLIKELFKFKHMLITAPSRFGKTLNMDMVRTFVEIEMDEKGKQIELQRHEKGYLKDDQPESKYFQYFKGKKIFDEKQFMSEHFGQYPTIYVDFHNVEGDNFEEILSELRSSINQAFLQHRYLENSSLWNTAGYEKKIFLRYVSTEECESLTQEQVQNGLAFLAQCLYYHHKKEVYVFIDEFDVPMNAMVYENVMTDQDKQLTINCLRKVVGNALNANFKFVTKSLSNGCQQLAGILSHDANNVAHYPFMRGHEFCEFYGFLEDEMLCDNEIEPENEDLFLQFVYEQGFFYLISFSKYTIQLGVPNKAVFEKIRQIVSNVNMINRFCYQNRELVNKFTDAIDDLAKSCTKEDVLNVAESVKNIMIVKELPPANKMNFQFHLCSALKTNKFRLVDIEHKTSKVNLRIARCLILVVCIEAA
ncbi:hypothetical protein PV327_002607 [Microctonus hyperodae]|uniref:AAA-ATPase-like domain-containing protein n=1 Tax=Microctonus hyperodae TaxID=165561 RepID=A0AA39FGA7_MICHY|nr:hypothetical protein PV327_002607 [Microctonus hyperodae]